MPQSSKATVAWTASSPYGNFKHGITFDFNGTDANPVEVVESDVVYWIICHMLIDALPKTSLAEAAENIADVYRHHLTNSTVHSLAATKIHGALVGRFGAQRERSPMTFSDEM